MSFLYSQCECLQDYMECWDPDSNRGHHDFQLGKTRSPLFLTAQKSP